MARMSDEDVVAFVAEPHVAVLSVSRPDRGPVAIPVWYEYSSGCFWISTTRKTLHSRLIDQVGRATLTIHADRHGESSRVERYVMAEGPAEVLAQDPLPLLERVERRYGVGARVEEWVAAAGSHGNDCVVKITPAKLSGYEWLTEL